MDNSKTWLMDLLALLLIIGVFFACFLGSRSFTIPDEGRYAEIPHEMLVSGDYVTPHINYIKYFEKPPFFYWLQAASLKVFGLNEWAARIPNALMALLGCLMTYVAGRKLYDRRTGWLASLILATGLLYYGMARFITLDMTVSVFLTGSLFSFLLAQKSLDSHLRGDGRNTKTFILLMYIFSALATLTKGMIGFIFPGMIIFVWLFLFNDWRNLKYYLSLSGILLWLLIVLPWHILVQLRNPEFFHFYIIEQHFARYFTTYANRDQAFWVLPSFIILGFLPWTAFLLQALKSHWPKSWKQRFAAKEAIFLMLWAGLIYLFFQFSHSQLPPYVLPIFPPLAILVGNYLANAWQEQKQKGIFIGLLIISLILLAAIIIALILASQNQLFPLPRTAWLTLFLAIGTAFIPLWSYWLGGVKAALITLFITLVLLMTSLSPNYPLLQQRSTKTLAAILLPMLTPSDQVTSYHSYFQDLPFYLQRRVALVGWGVDELDFGIQHQNMEGWLLEDQAFWQQWQSGTQRIFMFLNKNDYNALSKNRAYHLCLIAETPDIVLMSNRCN